jgi:hypothetical protein
VSPRQLKMKAEIIAIGQAWPHEPDQWSYIWTVQNWYFGEGDFPGVDPSGLTAGWTAAELALIADLALVAGSERALRQANQYRSVAESTESAAETEG